VGLITRAASFARGLASPKGRVETAQKLLAYTLSKIDWTQHLEIAPPLPEQALISAKLYSDREAMLHALPKGGIVAEVGVYRGEFSNAIARICKPAVFHLIDIDFGPLGDIPMPVEKHEGDSSTVLSEFEPCSFDWIYIDADHSYDGVMKDLAAAHRALKPGGLLMCNDYSNWCSSSAVPYGVARAVNEFVIRESYAVLGLALQGGSLPDILIEKP
jgi:SAM-dependent methyltransferase